MATEQEIQEQPIKQSGLQVAFNLILLFIAGIIFLTLVSGALGFVVSIFVKAFNFGYRLW